MYGSGGPADPVHTGHTAVASGQGSHFGSGNTAGNDPLSTSTNPTGRSQYSTGNPSQGLKEPYASRMPGGFDDDAATTSSVRSGVPGYPQSSSTATGRSNGTDDPNLTNKPLPREPASAGTGRVDNTGISGHTSSFGHSTGNTGYGLSSSTNNPPLGYGSSTAGHGQNTMDTSLPDRTVGR